MNNVDFKILSYKGVERWFYFKFLDFGVAFNVGKDFYLINYNPVYTGFFLKLISL